MYCSSSSFFFFQAEDGIRDYKVTGVQTCALPICSGRSRLVCSFTVIVMPGPGSTAASGGSSPDASRSYPASEDQALRCCRAVIGGRSEERRVGRERRAVGGLAQ